MTTVRQRQKQEQQGQEQLRKTTIQTTIQHLACLPVVDVDAAATATCGLATFLIPRTTWKTNQEPWTTTRSTTTSNGDTNNNNKNTTTWYDIGDKKAVDKTSQAT